jgi:hypothetical protein
MGVFKKSRIRISGIANSENTASPYSQEKDRKREHVL